MAQFKVHNLIIVDASGSMTSIYEQALAGINETLSTIREEAKKSDKIEQSVTVLSFASGGEPLQYGVSRNLVGINFRHPNVMPNFAVWKTITYRHWHRWCCQPRF